MQRLKINGCETLPALQIADIVNQRLATNDTLVVTAPPGAGKSTLLPLTLLNAMCPAQEGNTNQNLPDDKVQVLPEGKILLLEPRRLAARQIAERMASMIGEPVGKTVGYRIRFDNKVSKETRIEVLTEGILTRMLIADPTLEGVSMVIFDEFHERSLHSDVALALTREAQQIIRPDLRIVLMSATIDAASLCQQLDAQWVESEGRMFPVEIRHAAIEPPMQSTREIAQSVTHQILEAHRNHEGDILAFLPGEAEIRLCQEMLQDFFPNGQSQTHICPLYGMLSQQEQRHALIPSADGHRKIVLATPIAETSLTIEGIRIVVDSGRYRKMVFDPQSGLSHLQTCMISLDMANQRSGRAGRLAEGICYRMWTLATEHRMNEMRAPEITEADLSAMMLDVAAWGESRVENLLWLTPPPTAHVAQASRLLQLLQAIDAEQRITPHGRKLAAIPCHPRIAQMLLSADNSSLKALGADIAALLEERDPMASGSSREWSADINIRIEELRRYRTQKHPTHGWDRILKIANQYLMMLRIQAATDTPDPYDTGRLIAAAFPERVANIQNPGTALFRMASGEQAALETTDHLAASDWIAIANVNTQNGKNGRIFLASPLHAEELKDLIREKENVAWDSRRGCIVAQRESRIGCLTLASKPIQDAKREEIIQVICEAARKEGVSMFDFNDHVQNLQRRVAVVSEWHPELHLPDLGTDSVLQKANDWLPFYIGKANTVTELKKIDLMQALWGLLDYEQQQKVDLLAPTHIQVPSGSRIRIEYRQGAELPILRVRLQECFGLTHTPRVDEGRRPVLMELLSPGFKPVQLTQDLHSFWQDTYFEVRKELRRRYPKHAWPDNPLEAEAIRGVKRQ